MAKIAPHADGFRADAFLSDPVHRRSLADGPSRAMLLPPALSASEQHCHAGEFAVFADGILVGFHTTGAEALAAAASRFRSGNFSIHKVRPTR